MRHAAQLLVVGLMTLGALLLSGVADEGAHAAEQTLCPVMEGSPVKQDIYVDHQGQRVYFCCLVCQAAFTKDPEKYIPKLPQFSALPESHDDDQGHDHAVDHGTAKSRSRLLAFLGKFHPIAIHIPIALVLAAALAEALGMLTKKTIFESISRFNINVAVLGAAASVGLGLLAGMYAIYSGDFARPFLIHKWLGIATGVAIVVAATLSELSCRRGIQGHRWGYQAVLLLCVVLVCSTGYFGGQLVYGLNHYAW
jgi:uncharacterized membrane protein/YHS domain-containing protein